MATWKLAGLKEWLLGPMKAFSVEREMDLQEREDEEVCEKGGSGIYEWGIKMQFRLTQEGRKKRRCKEKFCDYSGSRELTRGQEQVF